MTIEILDLPINSMVIFYSYVNVYQRVRELTPRSHGYGCYVSVFSDPHAWRAVLSLSQMLHVATTEFGQSKTDVPNQPSPPIKDFFFALTAYFQDLTLQKKWGFQLSSETDVLRFGRCSHLPTMVKTRKFWRPFLEYLMIEPFSSYHRVICPIGDDVPTVSGSPFIGCMTGKSQGRMTIALPCADHGDSTLNLVLCRFCSGSLLGSEQHRGCVPTISPRS